MATLGCGKSSEKIVLTCGLGMNPNASRFGLEIQQNKIFYCEEIPNQKGKYNYYISSINSEKFLTLKNQIKSAFEEKVLLHDIVDARPYQLDLAFNNDTKTVKFYYDTIPQSV